MRILVIGAGALGSLFGARLGAAGDDVLLVDINPTLVAALNSRGLQIESSDGAITRYRVKAAGELPSDLADYHLVLVMTKSYDTRRALEPLQVRLNPQTFVLTLQNGLGNLELIRQALPTHERSILGTTSHGSTLLAPGSIRHGGRGATTIGDPAITATPRFSLDPIAAALTNAGFETTVAQNVYTAVWTKLIANLVINPITAITGMKNGDGLDDPRILNMMEVVIREALEVMEAAGVPRGVDDPFAFARTVMEQTRTNESSMLQDIRAGRRTEIDAINGAVVRLGRELGVPTPVNGWLTALVQHREVDARKLQP